MAGSDLEVRVAWERHVGRGKVADAELAALLARHRGPGRHYHDDRHVRWVVRHVLALADGRDLDDLDAVVAAAFFHDAVYDVDRHDNEARSADLAVTTLRRLGWDDERGARVAGMIVATEHRPDAEVDDTATAVLIAADLAVLATDPAVYSDAVRRIRREYGHLTESQWRAGRGAVLTGFLGRTSIFPPGLGLTTWERRARANLTAELAGLR